ncbi:MAG: hypothetical protein IT301_06660 [Dehalococcoidia bacterium]|nr:hypothetical protein [Dehalococcoidia bacterium]
MLSIPPIDFIRLEVEFHTPDGFRYIRAFQGVWLVKPEDKFSFGLAYTRRRQFVLYCDDAKVFNVYGRLEDMQYLRDIPDDLVSDARAVLHSLMGGPGPFIEEFDI